MKVALLEEYTYKIVDKYIFIKRVYFDFINERTYINLLVYTKKYQSDLEYMLEYIEPARFNEVAEQIIKDFLNEKGVFNY